MTQQNNPLKSTELLVLSSNASRSKEGAGFKLRVVQYHKAGKSIAVKLESGEYWTGDDGIVRFKAKGLTLRDLEELEKIDAQTGKALYLTVKNLMKSPPMPPTEEKAEQAPEPADPDAVPFS